MVDQKRTWPLISGRLRVLASASVHSAFMISTNYGYKCRRNSSQTYAYHISLLLEISYGIYCGLGKHVRACIVYTWDHKSSLSFWASMKVWVYKSSTLLSPPSRNTKTLSALMVVSDLTGSLSSQTKYRHLKH